MPDETEVREVLVTFILTKFDELTELLGSLDDDTANTELAIDGSNSVIQLVLHCCGMMRRWSSGVNLGVEIPRDRDAEFTARRPVREVLTLAARTRAAFIADVDGTDLAAPPAVVPAGRRQFWMGSGHGVLLHVLEEISQHLGHAEITRDVLLARAVEA